MSKTERENRTLLLIEDDTGLQSQLRWCFEGYDVHIADDRASAIAVLRRYSPAVITLDLGLPPDPANVAEGMATLDEILALAPDTKVIVVTGNDDRENALRAIASGAYDFYQKPVDGDVLRVIVDRAYQVYELEQETRRLARQQLATPLSGLLSNSRKMLDVIRMIEKVAPTNATLLLWGESGTGKELLARGVHGLSERNSGRFIAINCAAIPETLLESELFGYEKGAFTGAAKQTIGKIEFANGGTLFLDEIGDLPMGLQGKLLRFLQERVIERVGGRQEIPVDVRIVCATHRDLGEMIRQGTFREDLYYRLSEIKIDIPPLRDREGDAVLLARAFLDKFKALRPSRVRGFSSAARHAIESYSWPGNVRELENKVKRASIMADGPLITPAELELEDSPDRNLPLNLRQVRDEAERQVVQRALNYAAGNIAQAAELLGVSRPTLYDLMKRLNVTPLGAAQ